jgi:oxygen-dependent protoporphyrinogen oxidase
MGQKLAVLGGGISGLCLAYYLKKYAPEDQVVVLEKSSCVGGVIDSYVAGDLVFDKGPKTIRKSSGQDLLEIIHELGLQQKLITASLEIKNRYIFHNNSLKKLPTSFVEFFISSLTRSSLLPLIKELFLKASTCEDLSIGDFARKHLGKTLAENIVEPFVRGVCGASMEMLSLRSCFPRIYELEQKYGSILKGMIKNKKASDKQLFNLKGGFVSLINALESCGSFEVMRCQNVKALKWQNGKVVISTEEKTFLVDKVFSTLPLDVMQKLLQPLGGARHEVFDHVAYESLVGVSCAFRQDVIKKKGFGYLVPSKENQPIFGAIFDSCIFPSLDQSQLTKLTFLMPAYPEEKAKEIACQMLKKHLDIQKFPSYMQVFNYDKALLRYPVGFNKMLKDWLEKLTLCSSWLVCCGNYRHPPGVNYCVSFSKKIAKEHGVGNEN